MKTIPILKIVLLISVLALFLPTSGSALVEMPADAPPVAQPLIREGDFAILLVEALGLSQNDNEADAVYRLSKFGIAPFEGWMPNNPLLPGSVIELRDAVLAAAETQRLSLTGEAALEIVDRLLLALGLPVSDEIAALEQDHNGDLPPGWVDENLFDENPPIVTYYEPPRGYTHLYVWVPYPFWYARYYIPGFYIHHDYRHRHRVSVVKKYPHRRYPPKRYYHPQKKLVPRYPGHRHSRFDHKPPKNAVRQYRARPYRSMSAPLHRSKRARNHKKPSAWVHDPIIRNPGKDSGDLRKRTHYRRGYDDRKPNIKRSQKRSGENARWRNKDRSGRGNSRAKSFHNGRRRAVGGS